MFTCYFLRASKDLILCYIFERVALNNGFKSNMITIIIDANKKYKYGYDIDTYLNKKHIIIMLCNIFRRSVQRIRPSAFGGAL